MPSTTTYFSGNGAPLKGKSLLLGHITGGLILLLETAGSYMLWTPNSLFPNVKVS